MKKRGSKYWKETFQAYLFLLPSFAILGLFVFWPIAFSFVLSFFKWDYTTTEKYFIGFDNYKELFRLSSPIDINFFYSLINTVVYFIAAYFIIMLIYSFFYSRKEKLSNRFYVGISFPFIVIVIYFILRNTIQVYSLIHLYISIAAILVSAFFIIINRREKILHFFGTKPWLNFISLVIFFLVISRLLVPQSYDLLDFFFKAKESSDFLKAIFNTFYYVLLAVPTQILLALIIALLLNSKIKLRSLFRTAYFIPFVTSVVAVSLVWQWMFNDSFGLINYFLSFIGVDKIAWLKKEVWTIPTIAIVSVWQHLGYTSVIFLAGLQSIDKSYYEAATVDGANKWQQFKNITWPLLSPTTFFIIIITMIGSFKVFSQIFILYSGLPGPVNKSGLTLVYYVFEKFYNEQRMGVASAAAYILFLIILLLTFINFSVGRKRVHYES